MLLCLVVGQNILDHRHAMVEPGLIPRFHGTNVVGPSEEDDSSLISSSNQLQAIEWFSPKQNSFDQPEAMVSTGDSKLKDGKNPKYQLKLINEFNTKFPWSRPRESFYKINVGLNYNNHTEYSGFRGRHIMAYGFINNDKFNDIVVVSQNRSMFAVYIYNTDTTQFDLFPWHQVDAANA